jgi:hypothetical protein
MSPRHRTRPAVRRRRSPLIATVVVCGAALLGAFGYQSMAVSSSSASPRADLQTDPLPAPPPAERPPSEARADGRGLDDGAVPDGVTVFDGDVPAVARLDPDLLGALRRAATASAVEGIGIEVNSGWRSPAYQERLLDEAVATYGSRAAAARRVATPDTSAHVSGDAVDVGPPSAATWLARHGSDFGLCPTYRNEPWHFELRPEASRLGCPRAYADPTHDPRMR